MKTLVCDTNVFISAFVFRGGNTEKIVKAILAGHYRNLTSPDLLTELRRVFSEKFKLPLNRTETALELVQSLSTLIYPTQRQAIVTADETDNRVLECALEGCADFLITGDKKHLLPLNEIEGVRIISPGDFVLRENIR